MAIELMPAINLHSASAEYGREILLAFQFKRPERGSPKS